MKYNVPMMAKTLRNFRQFRGWTRKEMAAQIGLSENWLYKAEKELTPILSEPEKVVREKLGLTDAALIKFQILYEAIENNG